MAILNLYMNFYIDFKFCCVLAVQGPIHMITCGCRSYQRKCAVNQHHFSEIDGGPKACQRCDVFVLLSTKELEPGLRNNGSVHFFLSDDCRQPHKTGRGGTRNKIQKCFMFVLVVLPAYIVPLSRGTKAVRFIRCCTANET